MIADIQYSKKDGLMPEESQSYPLRDRTNEQQMMPLAGCIQLMNFIFRGFQKTSSKENGDGKDSFFC